MKYIGHITRWIFILCLPLVLLSGSIGWVVNSLWIYENGFEEYEIGQVTGLAEPELEKAARGLISYFNSGEEYINVIVEKDGRPFVLFNEREIIHLKDVKGLFRLDYLVFLGTLVYILGYDGYSFFRGARKEHWRKLARRVIWGSGITLGTMAALGLGTLVGFDRLFRQFHLISFANDFWLLDPATDYLVMLFPQGFWYDVTIICALSTAAMAIILGGLAWGHLRFAAKT